MSKILTHMEIEEVWVEHGLDECGIHRFTRAIEAAIIAKLNSAEPVGYLHPEKDKAISISDLNDQQLWTQAMWKIGKPLYLHSPAPSAANVPLTSKGKTNQLADFIHRFKRHVGGDGEFWLHELEDFYFGEVSAARSE